MSAVLTDDLDAAWARTQLWGDDLGPDCRLVACRCEAIPRIDELMDHVVRAFADVALADWPHWYGVKLPAEVSDGVFERNRNLCDALRAVSQRRTQVATSWLRRAAEACLRGERPFDADSGFEVQAGQLALAVCPAQLVIVLSVGRSAAQDGAPALVAVAEWLNRVTEAAIVLLLPVSWREEPGVQRAEFGCEFLLFGRTNETAPPIEPVPGGIVVDVSPLPGRPHPNSAAEQALYRRIRADQQLAALLEFNRSVMVDLGQTFRIDVLCRSRRVAVEIDGAEHRVTSAKYHSDCERDYQLMKRGYLVLRLPNELVCSDLEIAVARIKDILQFREGHQTEGS